MTTRMFARSIATFAAVVLFLASLVLGACGGSDDSKASAAKPETRAAAASTETKNAPATTAPKATRKKAPSNTKLAFTGAVAGEGTTDGACGVVFNNNYQAVFSLFEGTEKLMLFQIYIKQYKGPQAANDYRPEITLTDGMGTSWTTGGAHKGTVTMNADEKSGTVRATLFNKAAGTTVEVNGQWGCEPKA